MENNKKNDLIFEAVLLLCFASLPVLFAVLHINLFIGKLKAIDYAYIGCQSALLSLLPIYVWLDGDLKKALPKIVKKAFVFIKHDYRWFWSMVILAIAGILFACGIRMQEIATDDEIIHLGYCSTVMFVLSLYVTIKGFRDLFS